MRPANKEDVPRLVELGRRFHEAKQDQYPFDPADTAGFFNGLISSPAGIVLVTDGGFICGALVPAPSNSEWVTAFELFWWAEDRSGLRLLKGFEQWASDMGASEVKFSHPETETRVGEVLTRAGYAPSERVYGKAL